MAIKTFTTGEVLTAADTNTYLANSGLVYIASGTVTSGSSYLEILNCFSATYDNYRIVINNVQASASLGFAYYLGTNASSGVYYGSLYYDQFTGSVTGTARQNGGNFNFVGLVDSAGANGGYSFDLNAPFLAKQKTQHGTYDARNFAGWGGGLVATTSSFTGIRFLCEGVGSTLTAGSVRIYGYRQV